MKPVDILNEWVKAVNKGQMEKLISLYHPSAILIPTFSNKILNTPKKRREYFKKLVSREELGIEVHKNTVKIQKLNDQFYTLNGIYKWRFKVEGEILIFEARFSYIVDTTSSTPIVHHHSSQVPRML